MDPKDQPLCLVDWPSIKALFFYFIIPQDAGHWTQNVAYQSGFHPKTHIESMVLYGIFYLHIYPKDQPKKCR